jgi:hypothetical protein
MSPEVVPSNYNPYQIYPHFEAQEEILNNKFHETKQGSISRSEQLVFQSEVNHEASADAASRFDQSQYSFIRESQDQNTTKDSCDCISGTEIDVSDYLRYLVQNRKRDAVSNDLETSSGGYKVTSSYEINHF